MRICRKCEITVTHSTLKVQTHRNPDTSGFRNRNISFRNICNCTSGYGSNRMITSSWPIWAFQWSVLLLIFKSMFTDESYNVNILYTVPFKSSVIRVSILFYYFFLKEEETFQKFKITTQNLWNSLRYKVGSFKIYYSCSLSHHRNI